MTGVVFRRLTAGDLDKVLSMNRTFREGFAEAAAAKAFLEDASCWLWAAVSDGAVIGFAYGRTLLRLDGAKPSLYIHEVGVAEGFQRRGVGFAMLSAMMDACRDSGVGKCFLFCDRKNAGANALYRKLGGEVSQDSQGQDTCYFFPL